MCILPTAHQLRNKKSTTHGQMFISDLALNTKPEPKSIIIDLDYGRSSNDVKKAPFSRPPAKAAAASFARSRPKLSTCHSSKISAVFNAFTLDLLKNEKAIERDLTVHTA